MSNQICKCSIRDLKRKIRLLCNLSPISARTQSLLLIWERTPFLMRHTALSTRSTSTHIGTHRGHSLTENFVLGSTSLLREAPTTPRQAEQRQPQSGTHVGAQVKPLVSLTHPPAVCDVAVCLCVSVSVCLELLLFRFPGWMIITTRSKETSLLCLRGASLTGEGGKNTAALLRKEGNERRIIFHRALCVCVCACVCEQKRGLWGWEWGKLLPVLTY